MDRFKEEHVPKKASQRSYHGYIKRLRPFFGPMTLAEITPKVIVQYKNKRYVDGVSPATINRELAMMKKAFNLARKEWEWCRDNPVSRVSLEKENNKRDRWLTHEEEERLLTVGEGDRGLCPSHRNAHGRNSGLDLDRGGSLPANGDRVPIQEWRAADHPGQSRRA